MANVAVISFPGSNCDRDIITAVKHITGTDPAQYWHKETSMDKHDLVILPGGFSFGDYLRCGAIAARSPIMDEVMEHVWRGGYVLGICNGFQILTEAGILPGTLMRNKQLQFVCRDVMLTIQHTESNAILAECEEQMQLQIPVAHNEGNYFADPDTLKKMADKGQIAVTYTNTGAENYNPNGAINDIAGVTSENGRVLGLMPHPERKAEDIHGGNDGRLLLASIIEAAS